MAVPNKNEEAIMQSMTMEQKREYVALYFSLRVNLLEQHEKYIQCKIDNYDAWKAFECCHRHLNMKYNEFAALRTMANVISFLCGIPTYHLHGFVVNVEDLDFPLAEAEPEDRNNDMYSASWFDGESVKFLSKEWYEQVSISSGVSIPDKLKLHLGIAVEK